MHHIKPTSKGDPLCPLGFHPQVRWPTRCKRCFRDYKEHGNRNKDNDAQLRRDELTVSTPALSSYSSRSRDENIIPGNTIGTRTWTSSSNLSSTANLGRTENTLSESSSWTSSPNLAEKKDEPVATVSFTLPRRRRPVVEEETQEPQEDYRRPQYAVRRRTAATGTGEYREVKPSLASNSTETVTVAAKAPSPSPPVQVKAASPAPTPVAPPTPKPPPHPQTPRQNTSDVEFIFRVKSSSARSQESPSRSRDVTKPPFREPLKTREVEEESSSSSSSSSSDEESVAGTETTETTIVNPQEQQLQEEIDTLKRDLDAMKTRCEKAEREKSDILLRRLATYETTTSKTTASEVLKLQQKCNEMKTTVEDLRDEKKVLSIKVRELEADLDVLKSKNSQIEADQLRAKLAAAETLCEELMEENDDMKRELREMEEEMVEMQDNFREDQADEYSSMKKELEQTNKNCRILSFKLRKAERKTEQLEAEKLEAERKLREIAGGQSGLDKAERIRQLEHDLTVANEAASRLQKELEDTKKKLNDKGPPVKKKAPMLGSLPKTPSGEKVSRESLTRGGSQEDPAQLLRDLQDSLEREADLREQLRQAEEEAQSLHKKASRVEDDNESLLLQLKKMATKARTRRLSPSPQRLTEPVEKDEGISDEEDPAELRLQLELNEQEASVLRRKVEELECEGDHLKKKVKDLQDKLAATKTTPAIKKVELKSTGPNGVYEQKMKVLEEETSELRKKLIEKDRECERLYAEMSIGVKKPKILQKSKSLDGDQQTVDLKRQLQVVEAEANILRTRIQNLESENEKLQTENKKLSLVKGTKRASSIERNNEDENSKVAQLEKQLEESKNKIKELEKNSTSIVKKDSTVAVGENEKLKTLLKKVETEKKKLEESVKRMKDEALTDILTYYQKRTPKIPTDLTTKLQMKKMVDEAEKEIGELLVILKKSENEKKTLLDNKNQSEETESIKDELEKTKWKLQLIINQNEEEATKREKEKDKHYKSITEADEEKNKLKKELEKNKGLLDKEKQKLQEVKNDLEKQKKTLSEEIASLKEELKNARKTKTEIAELKEKLDAKNTELLAEKKITDDLSKKLEGVNQMDSERKELKKKVEDQNSTFLDLEKKVKELEEKLKKSERLVGLKKDKVIKLEKEKEAVNAKLSELEKEKDSALTKQKETADKIKEAEEKINMLEKELEFKNASFEQMENTIKGEKDSELKKTLNEQLSLTQEVNKLQEELNSTKYKLQEMTNTVDQKDQLFKTAEEAAKSKEKALQNEIEQWEKKASELEMDLQVATEERMAERKMIERLKATQEKEIKSKDLELAQLRAKSHSAGAKKLADLKQEMQAQIDRLELALNSEKQEYDELTGKYEQLEEEHVNTKAQLVKDKEKLHAQLITTERDLEEAEADLKTLRETYNSKQDTWIKEKLNMQERLKDNDTIIDKWQLEKTRLQAICDERQSEVEQLRKESQGLSDQSDMLRKENEELRKQIDDYEKVAKVQRTMNADATALEKELKNVKTKLIMEEKARKTDMSSIKLRYENRVSIISAELLNTQGQLARFKKERDSYKHMVEAAQKTIAELKSSGSGHHTPKMTYEGEDVKDQVAVLEQQISCLEDELSESRVEASRLRTELVSERSAWEVQLSELNSRLNEMEEEKILSSGRAKITGLKTKMELAWQKEREEQHRILQETSTLARDLRQTLFEVERERDKERLEAKRRLDQQKKSAEEEQEEIRKKLNEMQCDLLELRDAHAKLRTTNEKMRREKERWEKEREILKQSLITKKQLDQDDERKIINVAQLVEELTVLAPDLFPSKPKQSTGLPTPPVRRKGSKSREASPALERKDYSRESSVSRDDAKSQEVQEILSRLTEATHQLKRMKRAHNEREAIKKAFSKARAASTESDGGIDAPKMREGVTKKDGVLRKSLSLEQTTAQGQQPIWKFEDDQDGSVQSLDEIDRHYIHRRDPSLDSRLSGGSTKSEMLPMMDKKKKSGLFGKLKKLTKSSRSMDRSLDSDLGLDRGSDTSLSTIDEKSKSFKLSGMFRKSGSTSRGSSLERNVKPPSSLPTDSTQRPLVNSSAMSNVSNSSDVSNSSKSFASVAKKPPSSAPVQRKVKK